MPIVLGVFVVAYLVSAYACKWTGKPSERLSFGHALTVALIPAVFSAAIIGGGAWAAMYQINQDPVDVNYSIYEGPNGRYVEDGRDSYGDAITYWYYKDGLALKRTWKDSSYVNVNYMPEDSRAYVEAVCDSSETVPHWLLLPWERDEGHVFNRECSYEDFDLFIPMGAS